MEQVIQALLETEHGTKIAAVLIILGALKTILSALATITPSKKVGKVASKAEAIGEFLNVVGIDLKKLIPKKK